jgi:hypothetical protein
MSSKIYRVSSSKSKLLGMTNMMLYDTWRQLSDGNAPFIFCKIGNMKVAKEKKIAKKT